MKIYDGRESFYQWDLNQKITSSDFKVGDEIHFHNIKQATALVTVAYEFKGKIVADVPNILLQNSYPIRAYRFVVGVTDGCTVDEHTFEVKQRAKPDDYVYTETEVLTITIVVNKAVEEATKEIAELLNNKVDKEDAFGLVAFNPEFKDDKRWTHIVVKDSVSGFAHNEKIPAYLSDLVDDIGIGNIDTALDSIIAIQNELMGVSE